MRLLFLLLFSLNIQALQFLQSKDEHNTVKQKLGTEQVSSAKELLTQLKKDAKRGNARSQFSLANMYHYGVNTKKDVKLAFYWYSQVAKLGYPSAQIQLANSYYDGIGTAKNLNQAVFWYEKAAQQGLIKAQYKLAKMYLRGEGVVADNERVKYWYERAAKLGYPIAQLDLAHLYDADKDLKKAQYWYEKAAVQSLNAEAQYYLADFFERTKKPMQALLMYRKSAEQGFSKAQSHLFKKENATVSLEEIANSLLKNIKILSEQQQEPVKNER